MSTSAATVAPAATAPVDREIREANIRMFDRLAPVYDCRCYDHLWKRHVQREFRKDVRAVLARVASGRQARVLDVGCGTGFLSLIFAREGASVTALDSSGGVVERLRARLGEPPHRDLAGRMTPLVADADDFLDGSEASYDVIAFNSVLHHFPAYARTVALAIRRLAPGGALYVNDLFTDRPAPKRPGRAARAWWYSRLGRLNYWLDYKLKDIRFGPKIPNPDGTMAEYHVTHGGMRWSDVAPILEGAGMRIEELPGRFHEMRFGLLWWLCAAGRFCLGDSDSPANFLVIKPGRR